MLSGLVSSGLTGPTRSRARQAKLTLTGVKNTFAGPDRFALDVVGGIARSNAFELSTNLITGGLVTQNGIEMQSAAQMYLNQGGNTAIKITGGVVRMNSTNGMQIGTSGTEVTLVGTANVLDQRSGVNAQTFRLYTTYTSATSYETLNLKGKAAANFEIGPESGSAGGTLRGLTIGGYAAGTATIASWLSFTSAGVATFAGQVIESPPASVTLATNGQFSIEMTSNTAGNLVYRGSDGTTRRSALVFA
jgi:hypothetical protein